MKNSDTQTYRRYHLQRPAAQDDARDAPKSQLHTELNTHLQPKGYTIVDEFGCAGFNTNKFLKYFGGINKGRPNSEDLKHAEAFAEKLKV